MKYPNDRFHEMPPLSFAQSQMWVIDQMTPGNPAYNLPFGIGSAAGWSLRPWKTV